MPDTGGWRRAATWRSFAALVVVLATMAVGASSAGAETSITVRAGAGERYTPGRDVALVVTVSSDSLLSGSVRATPREDGRGLTSGGPVEVPVEVAGGTEKQVVVVVPTSRFSRNGEVDSRTADLTVELVEDGTVLASDDLSFNARNWEETVGLLPELAALDHPDEAPLKFRTGDAALVEIDPLVLAGGNGALDAFHTIAALPSDVAALSPEAKATLGDWLASGGHLLVDGEAGSRVEGLPDDWQPGPGGWAFTGAGDVRLTGDRLAQGAWTEVLDPTTGGMMPSTDSMGSAQPPGYTITGSLGVDAGFRIPQLGALIVAMVVYVLLVGPILFFVLGRLGKRPLAWLAIPAVAVLFTAMFAVVGAQLRNNTEAAHATVVEIGPSGAYARTSTLVGSISGGTTTLQHPSGWSVERPDPTQQFNPFTGAPVDTEAITPALVARAEGSEANMNLDPGEFVLVQSSGPAPMFERAVEVTASADGTTITGTVRNNLQAELTQVSVLVGFSATSIDRLGPGEAKAFTVDDPRSMDEAPFPEYHRWTLPPTDAGDTGDTMMIGGGGMMCGPNGCMNMAGFGTANPDVDPDSQVNPAVWARYLADRNDALRSLDTISVVGWSNGVDSPLRTGDGEPVRRGRTAVVARAPIEVASLDTVGVRAQVVRETDFRKVDRNYDDAIVNGSLYRIVLPTEIGGKPLDASQVSIRFPVHLRSILVWGVDGSYTVVPEPGSKDERIVYTLSPEQVATGVVYVRTRLQDQLSMPANTQPPGMQGTMATVRAGWEIFTGSVDDVHDTDGQVIGGMGGMNGGGQVIVGAVGTTVAPETTVPPEAPSADAQALNVPTTAVGGP